MSDGSIRLATAWGYATCELRKPLLVKPDWLKHLRERRAQSFGTLTNDEISAKLKEVVQGTYCPSYTYADEAWEWNEYIDNICHYQIGFGDDAPRKARDRRKAGYTELLTPKEWLKVRGELKKIPVPQEVWTNEIWRRQVEALMSFLSGAELPDGVYMKRNRPKLSTAKAANLVWYLQHLQIINNDEIDICDDCGRTLDTASETHDWCPECGKMRCESCTTAPYYCQCECACGKHCECKDDD